MTITKDMFFSALPHADEEYYEPTARWMQKMGIDIKPREDMFLAQLGHESDGGNAFEEYASGWDYEFADRLGNTQPGDGPRFKGRGGIQLTGRHNYTLFTKYCREVLNLDVDFVETPELVSLPEWSGLASAWYWRFGSSWGDLNKYADTGDIKSCTKGINGGLNGYDDRVVRWRAVQAARVNGGQPLLRRGDKGYFVKKLQRLLGIYDDGDFGKGTFDRVREFQAANDLHPVDGIAGKDTWAKLAGGGSA